MRRAAAIDRKLTLSGVKGIEKGVSRDCNDIAVEERGSDLLIQAVVDLDLGLWSLCDSAHRHHERAVLNGALVRDNDAHLVRKWVCRRERDLNILSCDDLHLLVYLIQRADHESVFCRSRGRCL